MTTRTQVTSLFQKFAGQSATLVIPRPYIDFCEGDHLAALLLSQILYWSERTDDPDGWFAKSYDDWHEELGLTDRQVKRIVKGDKRRQDDGFSLESVGVKTKLARSDYYQGAATLHYCVDHAVLTDKINAFSQVPTIGGNDQCGKPPIAQNDDLTIAQNDHIHRLDHKEVPTASAVGSDLADTPTVIDPVPDSTMQKVHNAPDDFKAIQQHTVQYAFGDNNSKFGAAGDVANWALCRSQKVDWSLLHPDHAFTFDEWQAFCLWYAAKVDDAPNELSWPRKPGVWNDQAHQFRRDKFTHRQYMAKVSPPTRIEPPLTEKMKLDNIRELMTPFPTGGDE